MKKILFFLTFSILLSVLFFMAIESKTMALSLDDCKDQTEGCIIIDPTILFDKKAGSDLPYSSDTTKPDPNAPPGILSSAGAKAVKIIFTIAGILGVISMVVAGIMMVLAQAGNEELLNTGKKILIYSVIGMIVIAGAYAIILGISNIRLS